MTTQDLASHLDTTTRALYETLLPGDRFGLVGMRERTASVNGALDIESKRGTGTRLTVEIPIS